MRVLLCTPYDGTPDETPHVHNGSSSSSSRSSRHCTGVGSVVSGSTTPWSAAPSAAPSFDTPPAEATATRQRTPASQRMAAMLQPNTARLTHEVMPPRAVRARVDASYSTCVVSCNVTPRARPPPALCVGEQQPEALPRYARWVQCPAMVADACQAAWLHCLPASSVQHVVAWVQPALPAKVYIVCVPAATCRQYGALVKTLAARLAPCMPPDMVRSCLDTWCAASLTGWLRGRRTRKVQDASLAALANTPASLLDTAWKIYTASRD